jgi:hypothetical protein
MMRSAKQIFLFLITFTFTLLICEFFFRTSFVAMVSSSDFYNDIGRGNRSGLTYVYFNEGFGIGKYNKYRYLGEDVTPEKDPNTLRIALLGDSYIESFQVFERHYFGNIIEEELSGRIPNRKIEVLNFGRSGFDIGDVYAYHNTFVQKFDPDFVVYILSNDDLFPKNPDPLLPKVKIINDSLTINFDFDAGQIAAFENSKFFIHNFSIFQMMNSARKKAAKTPILPVLFEKCYNWLKPESVEKNSSDKKAFQLDPITKMIFEKLDQERVIVVNSDYEKFPEEILGICLERKLKFIDLSVILNSYFESGQDLNYWKSTGRRGHWNHKGHIVIGKFLSDQFKRMIKEPE